MTQENKRAPNHKEYQEEIELNGVLVWADKKLVPLLRALNEAGLITRSHCEGHGTGQSFVVIRTDNVTGIEVRNYGEYKELVLSWEQRQRNSVDDDDIIPVSQCCGEDMADYPDRDICPRCGEHTGVEE